MGDAGPVAAPAPRFAELGLPVLMVQALRREGIELPRPIQAAAIPDALAGRDVLGRAPTGSGKTLAFGLPMLARLGGAPAIPRSPRGLVLAPTRELALQIEHALAPYALGLRLATAVGGLPIRRQADSLRRGVDLLVATPGRLTDLVDQGAADLGAVRCTTVDEADHLADFGFLPQVRQLLDLVPRDGQRLLFSATLDDESVRELIQHTLRDPATHTVSAQPDTTTASHHLLLVDAADKPAVLAEVAARDGRTLMFVRTQYGAEKLVRRLRDLGIAAAALHGGKAQNRRLRTLAAFADGTVSTLVATDIAARGIHVDAISLVVHADPPADPKDYLHRAGRTARAGRSGTVVTLVLSGQRREASQVLADAEVAAKVTKVRSGEAELSRITGARAPSGKPLDGGPAARPKNQNAPFRGLGSTKNPKSGAGSGGGRGSRKTNEARKLAEARKAARVRRGG